MGRGAPEKRPAASTRTAHKASHPRDMSEGLRSPREAGPLWGHRHCVAASADTPGRGDSHGQPCIWETITGLCVEMTHARPTVSRLRRRGGRRAGPHREPKDHGLRQLAELSEGGAEAM